MKKIGIFFGSDTGNTEKIAKMIHKKIGNKISKLYDIAQTSEIEIKKFDILIFGIPTWYYGELQCDWDEFVPILKNINFKNKNIALFGCGDQEDYSEYFCDAIGIIYQIIKNQHGSFIGKWPKTDYKFQSSKALLDKNNFVGLIIDEDRQPEKTKNRVDTWVNNILKELKMMNII
ncbi:flavodoxin FldA [Buchnera aphidicola]|uniref:flavodoxin FldA n=1 Tax=Buchnera aphidicola TaxID=9 RepID=UPI003463B4B2